MDRITQFLGTEYPMVQAQTLLLPSCATFDLEIFEQSLIFVCNLLHGSVNCIPLLTCYVSINALSLYVLQHRHTLRNSSCHLLPRHPVSSGPQFPWRQCRYQKFCETNELPCGSYFFLARFQSTLAKYGCSIISAAPLCKFP